MASNIHKAIAPIIDKIIKDFNECKKIKLIIINDEDSKNRIDYCPDYIIKRKISNFSHYYIVFEVIDNQTDVKTMADVCRIVAEPCIRKAIFISCIDKKKEETDRIVTSLLDAYKRRFEKKRKKDIIDIASIQVKKQDKKEDIEKIILKEIKQFLPNFV